MKEIPLTQGKVALVDDEDFDHLSTFNWHAARYQRGGLDEIWYAVRTELPSRYTVYMHRQVMPAQPGHVTFHKNRDGLDNRRANLQTGPRWQVVAHRRVKPRDLPRGVYPIPRCKNLQALIRISGKIMHLGCFADVEEAAATYRAAHLKYFGKSPMGPLCADPKVSGLADQSALAEIIGEDSHDPRK